MKLNFRHLLILLMVVAPGVQVLKGAPVSPEKASAEASAFLYSRQGARIKAATSPDSVTLAYTSKSNSLDCFYIFNHDNGFVIISADDRLPQVLGYSENGAFDEKRIPENMKNWLNGYRDEIATLLPRVPEDGGTLRKIRKAPKRNPIEPLITTRWDQGKPYNNDCPMDRNTNQRSATGCVATATSQIMKYHNWPDRPEGSNAGVTFTGTVYNWRNMINEYVEGKYSSAESSAVATLMRQVGAAVNMQYSSYASGAYDYDVQLALSKYFKYSKGLTFYWKDYTLQREWNNIIYSELAAGRPVYYSGSSNQGGHAFICDGYSDNEYFHFNWGWGGYEDGYYLLSALNPASGGAGSYEGGYNYNQTILTNIRPISQDPDAQMQTAILATGGFYYEASNGGTFVVKNGRQGENLFYNPLGFVQTINVGLKIEAEDGTVTYATVDRSLMLDPFYGFQYIPTDAVPKLSNGTYSITLVVANVLNDEWIPVGIPLGEQNYVKLVVSGNNKTFSNEGPDTDYTPKLIVGRPEFTQTVYAGTSIPVRIPIVNVGEGDFNASLGFSLFDVNDDFGDVASFQDNVAVAAKSFSNLEFTLSDKIKAGTYNASMMDLNGNVIFKDIRVVVKDGKFTTPDSNVIISDIFPSYYTSGDNSPIYFTAENDNFGSETVNFGFELLDINSGKVIRKLDNTYNFTIRGNTSTRVSVSPFDFGIEPGEYLWRVISNDGSPLSIPAPLVVNSAEKSSGNLTYIVTDEKKSKAILTAPVSDPYSGKVTVPSQIDGYNITALRADAFTFATATEVSLPEEIKYIPSGCFYLDSQLNLLTLNSPELVNTGNNAFDYSNTQAKCWINVPDDLANTYRYSEISRWRGFLQPRWNLELNDVTIASGFPDINMLGNNISYCVAPDTPKEITFSAPTGKNILVTVVDDNKDWVVYQVVASGDPVTLPALGVKGAGRLIATATTDAVNVENLDADSDEICDVYTIDGKALLINSTTADRANLPAGIYILSTGKKLIKH